MQFPCNAHGLDSDHLYDYRARESGFNTSGDDFKYLSEWYTLKLLNRIIALHCTGQAGLLFLA